MEGPFPLPLHLLLVVAVHVGDATTIEMGNKDLEIPLKLSYVAPTGCTKGGCDDQGAALSLAAMDEAFASINEDPSLEYFHNLSLVYYDTSTVKNSLSSTVASAQEKKSAAVIGLSRDCSTEFAVLSGYTRMGVADACSIDLATYGSYSMSVILFSPAADTLSSSVSLILEKYSWSTIGIVTSADVASSSFYSSVVSTMTEDLRSSFTVVTTSSLKSTATKDAFCAQVAIDSIDARIFVVIDMTPNAGVLFPYLLCMVESGLFSSSTGEYAVVAFLSGDANRGWLGHSGKGSVAMGRAAIPPAFNVTQDDLAMAYRNLIVVSDTAPGEYISDDWAAFRSNVRRRVKGNETGHWDKSARDYDLLKLLAVAGMEILNTGLDLLDGTTFWEYMLQRNFTSIAGYTDYIDGYGMLRGSTQALYYSNRHSSSYSLWPQATIHVDPFDFSTLTISEYGGGLNVQWIKKQPLDIPECGFRGEKCLKPKDRVLIIAICSAAIVLCALVVIAALLFRRYRYERRLHSLSFLIDRSRIVLKRHVNVLSQRSLRSLRSLASMGGSVMASQAMGESHFILGDYDNEKKTEKKEERAASVLSSTVGEDGVEDQKWQEIDDFAVGFLDGQIHGLKRIYKMDINLTRVVRKEILTLAEIVHDNVIPFRGLVIHSPDVFIVTDLAARGSLKDLLENDQLPLEDIFINNMTRDIVYGLDFLHICEIGCHGRLKSSNCLIDSRWMVKLSSFGLRSMREDESKGFDGVQEGRDDLSCAPELLRTSGWLSSSPSILVRKADIYSLAILLYEIFGKAGPWGDIPLEPRDILARVRNYDESKTGSSPFRPLLSSLVDVPDVVRETVPAAWAENPMDRPNIGMVKRKLRSLTTGMKKSIMDNMVAMVEQYTARLERDIAERNEELQKEKEKSDHLLQMMLPVTVAEALKSGKAVQAENFESVTVYFSDCPGFVEMTANSKPMEVVAFLNDLYTMFDDVIDDFDVYKVETIADSYMCVSGLPEKNGGLHPGECASLALKMIKSTFSIRHMPGEKVRLRIGMNTGPCVAGVIGLKMPRYCLFGDSVNTASRMESNGVALKINISQSTKSELDKLGGYSMEERGMVEMKGKGQQMTYFVTNEEEEVRMNRLMEQRLLYPSIRRCLVRVAKRKAAEE